MINHVSHALAGLPEVQAFLENVDAHVVVGDYESFWAAIDGFEVLVSPSVWQDFYASVVLKLVSDPKYNGGRDWGVHGFVLCDSDKIHLSIRSSMGVSVGRNVVDPQPAENVSIASTLTAPSALIVASNKAVTFNVFRVPEGVDLDVFDPSVRIEICDPIIVQPWSRIDVRAPRETLELAVQPSDDYCVIELAMRSAISQRWEFDRRTGTPLGAVLVSRDTVVLRSMLAELSRFRYAPALHEVLELASHPDFNVRWAAVKCAWAIDPVAGKASIQRAANDSHPYVRRAAAVALRNLERDFQCLLK